MRIRHALSLCCAAALLLTGCAPLIFGGGALAGAGVMAYAQGDVTRTVDVPVRDAHRAAEDALYELNYGVTGRNQSEHWTKIWALTPDDRKVTIQTESRGPNRSQISVRAGYFGGQDVAEQVLEKIEKRASYASAPASLPAPTGTRTGTDTATDTDTDEGPWGAEWVETP